MSDAVEVVNYSAGNATGLVAEAEILNMDGSRKWTKSVPLDAKEDSVQSPIQLEYPSGLTAVHFIRLKLTRGGQAVPTTSTSEASKNTTSKPSAICPK